ncbi:hypothetical protein Lal_00018038 [Lupinus albus]|nr:hypothetical protein Lal_00018038 [Lupinus albus]
MSKQQKEKGCAPDPKLKSPAGIGKTFESTIGSDIGSVGISRADSRRIALNMATSSLAMHCSMTC